MQSKSPITGRETKREENPFEDETVAQEWIRSVEGGEHRFRDGEFYPRLQEWLGHEGRGLVVDIGCGQGICSSKLGNFQGRYVGVEPSKALVDRAKELYPSDRSDFVAGDAYQLPVEEKKADAAFSIMVWFHLEDVNRASGELARILKPNGRFLIITANPNAYDIWKSFYSDYEQIGHAIIGKMNITATALSKNVLYLHALSDIRNALEHQNLNVERMEEFGVLNDGNLFLVLEGSKRGE